MTEDEVFEKVANHLLDQGEKAQELKNGFMSCRYRVFTPEKTLKCAIGCLIEDKDYDPKIENLTSTQLLYVFPCMKRFWSYTNLLATLQRLHDAYDPSSWKGSLKEMSEKYSISEALKERLSS